MNKTEFVAELSKLRPSATFLSLLGYRNEFSEVADYSLVFHINYENALKRSVEKLRQVNPTNSLELRAKEELIDGYTNSLKKISQTSIEEISDAYTRFFDSNGNYIKGIRAHTATGVLYLYGFVNCKRVIIPGTYPMRRQEDLTMAKNKLRKMVPVSKFRQFIITPNRVNRIAVASLSLLPPS
jgi:hypothetical protein